MDQNSAHDPIVTWLCGLWPWWVKERCGLASYSSSGLVTCNFFIVALLENIFYKWTPGQIFSISGPEYRAPSILAPQVHSRVSRTVVPYPI
jgi:hypothetical protein